jgi:Holliday junction DNA helicase RuvA
VGRKTAERIVVELKDKLAAVDTPEPERGAVRDGGAFESDVVSALVNLGYDRRAAEKAVEDVPQDEKTGPSATFETLLRVSLQQLSGPAKQGARGAA